jgi:hypothetical protein
MASKKKALPAVFAVHEATGKLFVKADACMGRLVAQVDGLRLVFFGRGRTPYLEVDSALDWYRQEAGRHPCALYAAWIRLLERARADAAAGRLWLVP